MNALLQAMLRDLSEATHEQRVEIAWQPPTAPAGAAEASGGRGGGEPLGATDNAADRLSIELHPAAHANFDTKAEALLSLLVATPADGDAEPDLPSLADQQVVTQLPRHARSCDTSLFRDASGSITARAFIHDGCIVGLQAAGYRALRLLAESMQSTRTLRPFVTVDGLEALIFDWVHAHFAGRTRRPMVDTVLEQVVAGVASFEAVIPLFRVEMPEPIVIGRVTLRTITAADFTRWEAIAASDTDSPAVVASRQAMYLAERERVQGFAAATMTMTGDSDRVRQIALDEADQAAALLRLFSPAMLSPRGRSFCTVWGRENIETSAFMLFDSAGQKVVIGRHMDAPGDFIWRLDASQIRLIRAEALDALARRLFAETLSDFEEEVRAALLLYSQTALRSTPTDKLLAVVLPLEAFLRRNETENITETFALRLAFATGGTRTERRQIADVAKSAYQLRSRYVHHGKAVTRQEDLDTVGAFMLIAWRFFIALGLQVVASYPDRAAYLASLDDQRFGVDG